jgi:anthranilate phosphoribosyltransferase
VGERTWPPLLVALIRGEELSTADTAWAMGEIMAGEATPAQIAAFMVALRAKGETATEFAGLVEAMLAAAVRVDLAPCSVPTPPATRWTWSAPAATGPHTVNISTMAAIVVAGAGVRVVKHGNRAASSLCGTGRPAGAPGRPADPLARAGVPVRGRGRDRLLLRPQFPQWTSSRRGGPAGDGHPDRVQLPRSDVQPGPARAGAIGCADPRMAAIMAEVFAARGDSVLVLHGEDGLDEFTTTAPTRVWSTVGGQVEELTVDALDLGIARSQPEDLRGGEVTVNAGRRPGRARRCPGPVRDAVLLNAAAAIVAYDGLGDRDLPAALRAGPGAGGAGGRLRCRGGRARALGHPRPVPLVQQLARRRSRRTSAATARGSSRARRRGGTTRRVVERPQDVGRPVDVEAQSRHGLHDRALVVVEVGLDQPPQRVGVPVDRRGRADHLQHG